MFEKEAEEYTCFVKATKERWNCEKIFYADIELAYQRGAEFGYNKGKAETALLSQHILDLQKDKGNLTDKVKELEAQIEKMKCCSNCRHSRTEYEHCRTNKHEKWEIKENAR